MSRLRRIQPFRQSADGGRDRENAWSVPLGVWAGVPVRAHVSLAVVLVLAIGTCVGSGASSVGWLALGVYLGSLALHELAHLAAATGSSRPNPAQRRPSPVVLGPLGGLGVPGVSVDLRERVFVAMAGPVANLAMVVAGMCCLAGGGADFVGGLLIDPARALLPDAAAPTSPLGQLAPLLIAVNWPLFLLNIIPSAPFDGGVALRAWLSLGLGVRPARDASCFVALLVASGLFGAGGALVLANAATPLGGAAFGALAIVIAFGARADAVAPMEEPSWENPLDLDNDFVGLSLSDLSPPRAARGEMAAVPTRHEAEGQRVDGEDSGFSEPHWDDSRVDAILAKVHAHGVQELTANERAILERASEFYQRRRLDN